jgi:hypothetical protein
MPMKVVKIVLSVLGVLVIFAGWQAIRYWMRYGYSVGTRSGVVRKISVKGPPYCKYLAGELALQGAAAGQPVEVWDFTVDDDRDTNPLVAGLHDAERAGKLVTLRYRQDLRIWWRCNPSEYYVTGIEK